MRPGRMTRPGLLSVLPLILSTVAAVGYASISIYRHNRFGSNAFDLGVQDQTVWGYSQLQFMPNTVEMIRNLLGDHFHPILMSIAPLYWIWNDVRVLLLVQAILLAVAGIPVYWWARARLGLLPAIAFEAAFLIFWGILSGVVYDFHHIAFAVPAVAFALYAVLTRNNRLFWPMLAIGLLTRENVALTFAALGIYAALFQRRWQLGAGIVAISLVWFVGVIEIVMPAIAGTPYGHWTYDALGTGPGSALLHIVRHPISSLRLLFDNATKLKLWGGLLGAWLFLPLLSPLFLVAAPSLVERLWSSNPMLWSASYHYSLVIAPILAFATIDSLARIARASRDVMPRLASSSLLPSVISVGIVAAGAVLTFAVVRPLDELGGYVAQSEVTDIDACLKLIPASASVSASNSLLPHLSHRRQIYLLTKKADGNYLAIDLAAYLGHFFPGEEDQIRNALQQALTNGYGVACSRGSAVLLQRDGGDQPLAPALRRFIEPAS